jgi:hypothetical protein
MEWMKEKKVAENGFPCQDCMIFGLGEPTGFALACERNGICKTCGGKKSVKGRLVAPDVMKTSSRTPK